MLGALRREINGRPDTRSKTMKLSTKKRSGLRWSAFVIAGSIGQFACSSEEPGARSGSATPPDTSAPGQVASTPTGASAGTTGTTGTPGTTGALGTTGTTGALGTTGTTGAPNPSLSMTNASVPGTPVQDQPSAGFTRRLTHIEFDNTVADLLGIAGQHSASLAADVAVQGFTNNVTGQNVTPTLAEQYIELVEGLGLKSTTDLNARLGCDPAGAGGETACVEQFVGRFGKRAWRRPLTTEEQTRALDLFRTARDQYTLHVSVQMLVQYFLLSPYFLYLIEPQAAGAVPASNVPLDGWRLASRLSYFLTGSMPDDTLLAAAEAGTLNTGDGVANEARRLLKLPRARQRIGLFFTEWLRLRNVDKLQKDTALFPSFDLSMGQALREQVELFAQSVILDDGGTSTDLFTAPYTFVNSKLAPLYGVPAPAGSGMMRVSLDPAKRAGLLTHAALLATFAHQNQTDPVSRGKFVRESVLCGTVPAPPPDLEASAPVVTPGMTTRERFKKHQEDPGCGGCHVLMDPIGLGFENYDPIGQWRDLDNGLPVDATGEVVGTDVAGEFDGAVELSKKLAASDETMACFAKTWLRFALGRSEQPDDAGGLAVIGQRFEAAGSKISELLVAITQTNTFRYQRVLDPNVTALTGPSMPVEETTP
jgi:hypothetical protein